METQTDLFATVLDSLDEKFERYHRENPQVFELFRRFAFDAKRTGRRIGAKAIMERIRWEMNLTTRDSEGFKINNNYTSRYVRLLEEKYPEFKGFFEKRELRS